MQTSALAKYIRNTALAPARRKGSKFKSENDDVFVHLRLGDMASTIRSAADYVSAIAACNASGKVFIASDSPQHRNVKEILDKVANASLILTDDVDTILFGTTRAHLVLSDGTYSWVIGALARDPKSVRYLPRQNAWHGDIFVFPEWQKT